MRIQTYVYTSTWFRLIGPGLGNMSGLPEDILKAPLSIDHANIIATKITSWKLLGPYIGLDEMDQEDILKEDTVAGQRMKMMQVWRHKHRDRATYLLFVRGCERALRRDLVDVVYQLLKKIPSDKSNPMSNSTPGASRLGKAPTMPELFVFTGKSGKQFRLLDRIAPYWEEFAFALHFQPHITEAIKQSSMFQVNDCCRSIVQRWLQGYTSSEGPVTWETFLSAMGDVKDLTVLTAEIRAEM